MRTLALICIIIATYCAALAGPDDGHDSGLVSLATNIKTLHRVTDKPHPMRDSTVALCRPPTRNPHNIHEGFVQSAYCNVYVNDLAKQTMQSGKGTYPVGSLIVKSKLRSKDNPDIELFTVMRKMADGYDASNGNWEYSIVDGRSQRVFASGRIDSCVACHTDFRATDYVTRTYMPNKAAEPGDEPKSR